MIDPGTPARRRSASWGLPVGLAVALAAASGFGWLLLRAQDLPSGVVPITWDKEACAHCRMHVGEKGFASQLQLADGRVLSFDDPGCLFGWLDQSTAAVHAVYLHHHSEERWLSRAQAGFIEASPSPMGFGLAAVDAPGALSWEQAAARVRAPRAGAP